MALSKQSLASTKTLRSAADSTKENVESPALFTRSKKLRSSENVIEAPKSGCGDLDSASTRQSRKSGSRCDVHTGNSSRFRQPLSGIQDSALGASFMTRGRKSRTEQRLAKALNWNPRDIRNLPVPSQESHLGFDRDKRKEGDVGGSLCLQRDRVLPCGESHLSRSQSSQASFSPSGILRTDEDEIAVLNEDGHVQILSSSSDFFPALSGVSPSLGADDASDLAVRHEEDVVQTLAPESYQKPPASSEVTPSSEDDDFSVEFEVTPARQASSSLARGALRTPEHLVPALGEGTSQRDGDAATEGNLRVYERRTSDQLGRKSSRPKTCPQLRGTFTDPARMRGKGAGSHHYSVRSLKGVFTPQRKVGSCQKKTSSSSSQVQAHRILLISQLRSDTQSNSMLLPESYRKEKCAYFAEVDAFELLEEEVDEEDDLEEPKNQKATVE